MQWLHASKSSAGGPKSTLQNAALLVHSIMPFCEVNLHGQHNLLETQLTLERSSFIRSDEFVQFK